MGKLVFGPLSGPLEDRFGAALADQGYKPTAAGSLVVVLRDLSRWMCAEGVASEELTEDDLERFGAARAAAGRRRYLSLRALGPVVGFLRGEGLVLPVPPVQTPVTELISVYQAWLVDERGLAARTVERYVATAMRLSFEPALGPGGLEDLSAGQVRRFLLEDCPRLGLGSAKTRAGEVRAFCKFLFATGRTPRCLATAVPSVAGWRGGALPKAVSAEVAAKLLASCDRSAPTGQRDFAILTLLARLGLRAAEVAGLELADIDWRAGEVVVRGKSRRSDRLPLPADVGEALVGYIAGGRPKSQSRKVFLRGRAPCDGINPTTVTTVVHTACKRAGLPLASAHRLRHGVAVETLRQGGSLAEISQLLRHSDLATTAYYAKVDREALRSLALPWPGGL
jgi:integrase/recombinase XerD